MFLNIFFSVKFLSDQISAYLQHALVAMNRRRNGEYLVDTLDEEGYIGHIDY